MPRVLILSNPRSGSTLFQELINSHPEVEIEEELLNDEFGLIPNPLKHVQDKLDSLHCTYVGFKVFPEQIFEHHLNFGELLESNGVTHVVVLWRENILEGLVSRRIADLSGEWYSTSKPKTLQRVSIDPEDLQQYKKKLESEWHKIGMEWPVDVRPIFVKFEDLIRDPLVVVRNALAQMSLSSDNLSLHSQAERQNPASVEKKVTNFADLPVTLRETKLDVEGILQGHIKTSLQIPPKLLQYAPDREPSMPPGGWIYRVAEPYLPAGAKQNAFDAINSGSISSAGFWPREMAKKLRSLFGVPVAQPCSNGFTALLLAMQSANIGVGDEVIVPTMTMVAVPNAVWYLKATPVFADNQEDTYNPGWAEYERVSSSRTRAIVVTHTYGVPCPDIQLIAAECKARGWILIEDISECVGITISCNSEEKLLGTFGDYAIASLYANKIIHGGDGGFVLAKQARLGKRLASIVNHGFTPSFHFVHFEQAPNAKIHGIGAAIASGCLDDVKTIMEHRAILSNLYRKGLSSLPLRLMPPCGAHDTPWVFGVQCPSKEERTRLRAFLAQRGIETRDFFFNLHLQPAYLQEKDVKSLPNAEVLGSTGFYLPTHSNLKEDDVAYICHAVSLYYSSNKDNNSTLKPIQRKAKFSVQIHPDGFALEVRRYKESGELLGSTTRNHIYLEAVRLGLGLEETLFHERYDHVYTYLSQAKDLLRRASQEKDPLCENMEIYFRPFISYYEAHVPLEQTLPSPWLAVSLESEIFQHSKKIPTTTDPETLQLLAYILEKYRPETIWEIGSWLGHATTMISEYCTLLQVKHRVFACDAFKWQAWMQYYLPDQNVVQDGKSFLEIFEENLGPYKDNIESVEWPYDISKLPVQLENQRPDLIFLDITQDDDDLEHIWSLIRNNLVPQQSIILFNGLAQTSIKFFTRHANELKPIHKPQTMAKCFLFVTKTPVLPTVAKDADPYDEVVEMMKQVLPLPRQFNFHPSPGWDHHHRNLFCRCIDLLKSRLHSESAKILFIPAVEETMCDEPEIFYRNPWVGIIHSVAHHPELFYTPDLSRLCSSARYLAAMKTCRGLFTLTQFQATYLQENLPHALGSIPIQSLTYPTDIVEDVQSLVPELLKGSKKVELLHVGSFARDFSFFLAIPVPSNFQKVLVAGDEETLEISKSCPTDVIVIPRLDAQDYEEKLKSSVVFLTLKYEGAANTLILECIARNVPILAPNMSSCVEYLGAGYPLYYDPKQAGADLNGLLSLDKISAAVDYLKAMEKSRFSQETFLESVERGAVIQSLAPASLDISSQLDNLLPERRDFNMYDVTIAICSWKRTHHLPRLLDSLWSHQDFSGSFQIILWNNNDSRNSIVRESCMKYIKQSNHLKSLELISSTENYYCTIRFALPALMKSGALLICDDDVIPQQNFVSFFYSNHLKHQKDVLCLRGHEFLEHTLDIQNPSKVWMDYDCLRFRNDEAPEQLIHFVHADACLIPKEALREIVSVPVPDATFALVDDYWMSYVLNQRFNRNLRKLSVSGLESSPILRTDDSDELGLALHTRPEVQDARLRLYVHHMLQGWPTWTASNIISDIPEEVKEKKREFWNRPPQIGFNVSSQLSNEDMEELLKTGTKCVRIGAVGVGGNEFFELSGFLSEPEQELERLEKTVKSLEKIGLDVVITLDRRLASERTWKLLAGAFRTAENVIGYDLINEPFTEHENSLHWAELVSDGVDEDMVELERKLLDMCRSIRTVDPYTTIVLEPSFWGRIHAIEKFPLKSFKEFENIVFSFHFYEPMALTTRVKNNGRYSFPGEVPWYDNIPFSEKTYWNEETILERLKGVKRWADRNKVHIFLGEFGVCRNVIGAEQYLKAVMNSCKTLKMTGLLFSFRDPDWEAMDYEFGENIRSFQRQEGNGLFNAVLDGIAKMKML